MKRTIDEFAGQKTGYSRSITIRNSLLPVGKTADYIGGFIEDDKRRREAYPEVKTLIDLVHKRVIEETLSDFSADWKPLAKALRNFQAEKNAKTRQALEKEQSKAKSAIGNAFKRNPDFGSLFNEDLFRIVLPKLIEENPALSDKADLIAIFNRFTGYFTGFHQTRENIYDPKTDYVSACYRIVNENFPKFMANAAMYSRIKELCPDVISDTERSLADYLGGRTLDSVFDAGNFNAVLAQSGITFYNTVIGGYTTQDGTIKIRGLNEHINIFRQTHSSAEKLRGKMTMLYKQILSDRETPSFIPPCFQSDSEVYEAVKAFSKTLDSCVSAARVLFNSSSGFDTSKIYVEKRNLTNFSHAMTGKWSNIPDSLQTAKKDGHSEYSLSELAEEYRDFADERALVPIYDRTYFWRLVGEDMSPTSSLLENPKKLYGKIDFDVKELQANKKRAEPIKDYLDAALELYHYLSLVRYDGDSETDPAFYPRYLEIMEKFSSIVMLYNKTRNYVTKKSGKEEKIKLSFGCPTLANGWDKDKENTYNTAILRRGGKYYLGVLNPGNKPSLKKCPASAGSDFYEKMVYKQFGEPSKQLPHVFFSKSGLLEYDPPAHILDGYEKKRHIVGDLDKKQAKWPGAEEFDPDYLHELIDWFKSAMQKRESWRCFNFNFSATSSYNTIADFYKEVADQGYIMSFQKIPASEIDRLVECGSLLLFQIYNKDFAEKATGHKNLHTLYWENLFSEENLKDTVMKLNGGAEIFFRPARKKLSDVTIHRKGSELVNRTTADGNTIPEDIYQEIYSYLNKRTEKISAEAKELLDSGAVVHKAAKHDIVKDRRLTVDSLRFHCPITMNFRATEITGKRFNDRVLEHLKNNPDVNILGIDRAETHLLSCTIINQRGEIILQRQLDSILQSAGGGNHERLVNYSQKLRVREQERDLARKNWQSIDSIKNLKEGYLSAAVHEIAAMMVEHNAILVMENLSANFKHDRAAVERQVYQKFETTLINKLNYLVLKNKGVTEPGGVLNAYQLADKFESFEKLGRQCGWVFYVSPAYTSCVDPATGFADLFRHSEVSNTRKRRDFFRDFKSIRYDTDTDSFAFSFRYSDDTAGSIRDWEVFTRGSRTYFSPREKRYLAFNPTQSLKDSLSACGIAWKDGGNLLGRIMEIPADSHSKSSADFFASLYSSFRSALQMRNRDLNSGDDYLISPVKAADGTFFDSRKRQKDGAAKAWPENAAASSAYHIALKGLYLMKNNFNRTEKGSIADITSEQWLDFVQKKTYAL